MFCSLGPFVLGDHLFNTRTGSVFRVTDKNSNVYAVKVFTYSDEQKGGHKERRLFDYANERSTMVSLTNAACPELLKALAEKSRQGESIRCENHHIQLVLGLDVPVVDVEGAKISPIKTRKMRLLSSNGEETDRRLDFSMNTLVPYMAGGRLGDLVSRIPKYQSMVVRYPLYVDVAPQMVDAVRFMHAQHIVHLGIQASTILCSSVNCEEAVLADPSTAWNGAKNTSSPYSNELMQQSVRFSQFVKKDKEQSEVSRIFSSYLNQSSSSSWSSLSDEERWEGTLKVDWYGLGGALFYVLAGLRPVAEDRSGANSHDAAEFIYKALQSQQLLRKVHSVEAQSALAKIRDQVAEGLLLVDGLLQADRSKRISFDEKISTVDQLVRTKNSLRSSSKALMSALQVDKDQKKKKNKSCESFITESPKQSQTLATLPVQDISNLPAFIQDICQ